MRVLLLKSEGSDVKKWQSFLFGHGYEYVETDGTFGPDTEKATKEFQAKEYLPNDGRVGNKTYAAAALKGFPVVSTNDSYPPKPNFPYPSDRERAAMFGTFKYERRGDGAIKILDDWARKNIVMVHIPQLKGIEGAPENCMIAFHRAGAAQLNALFAAWEKAGLLKYIRTWAGTYNPRMIRGSKTALSNHAYGAAFDINAAWNSLGIAPPLAGSVGSVVTLVKIANDHGFFWGGHYNNRKDGMHFEVAVLNRYPKTVPTFRETLADVVEAENLAVEEISSAAVPATGTPTVSPSEPADAADSESYAAGENKDSKLPADDTPPPIQVPQVVPETEPPKELSGIRASLSGAVTFLTTTGAGIFALFQGLQKEIVYGFFAAAAIVGIVFTINRFWFANQEKQRESAERMEREKRAHELQVLTLESAMNKNLNTVQIAPQPIKNSEAAASPAKFLNL